MTRLLFAAARGFDCMGDFAMAVWQGFKKELITLRAELAAIRAVSVVDVNAGLVGALEKISTLPGISSAGLYARRALADYKTLSTARTQQAPKGGE